MRTRFAAMLVVGTVMVAHWAVPAHAVVMCFGKPATIVGTQDKDLLRGTRGPDVIVGRGGIDNIHGWRGNDRICAGGEFDGVFGGGGSDLISGFWDKSAAPPRARTMGTISEAARATTSSSGESKGTCGFAATT